MTPSDHWIDHPQGRLFARQWTGSTAGAALPPLVLQHDSLGCVAVWRDFPERLAEATGRRVVAYDRLGFGRSDARDGRLPPDFIADEGRTFLPAVLAQLDIARFVALGHSVGGGMSVHIAAQRPHACVALVTIAAQAFVEDRTIAGLRAARASFAEPGALERLARYHGDKAGWVLSAWLDTWLDPAFAGWSLDAVLPQVRCPALVLHGELDEYGSAAHPQRIANGVGGPVRSHLLAGLGHVPQRERPEAVVTRVADFLASSASTAGSA